jgi:hypothetical protein
MTSTIVRWLGATAGVGTAMLLACGAPACGERSSGGSTFGG